MVITLHFMFKGDRAYDFLRADGVERIIFAFKHYHPKFRSNVAAFVQACFQHGQKYLEPQKLINYT